MSKQLLLNLLEEVIGASKELNNGEVAFFCPFCNHHKKKLQVNLETYKFHCWTCNAGGKSIYSLFKKLDTTSSQISRLNNIIGKYKYSPKSKDPIDEIVLKLPFEFTSILNSSKDPILKRARNYLKKRGITTDDCITYNIGYCTEGKYSGRIIIPSYDINGSLNYFVGRAFNGNSYKYKNPPVSKNIIGFESFVDWSNGQIILTEGVFDAIAIKRNAIPMFGKFLSKALKEKIVSENIKEMYIALDADARDNALKIAKYYIDNGITVYLINMKNEDPSSVGFIEMMTRVKKSKPLDFESLIIMKLN